jgi:hypothetical protein
MTLLWYVLTLVFGVIGLVAVVRIFEILILAVSLLPTTQLLIAIVTLLLAFLCLRKAHQTG